MPDESRPGKIKKLPINAKTGGQAQSNNPDTWTNFETALKAEDQFSGIGFMFANGYFGIDIDGVDNAIEDYRNGEEENIVAEFIHTLCSYSEYSVSGKGLHIICKGKLPAVGRRKKNVEMYSEGRFFIMTGKRAAPYAEIAACTDQVKPLHEKYIGSGIKPEIAVKPAAQLNLSESEIMDHANRSKQGRVFADLYAGKWENYFNSQSEADMSFCNILAFWCRRDEGMMDRIFRSSGLMRPKWERKQSGSTYGRITINKASQGCQRVYEPKAEYSISIGVKKPEEHKTYTLDDTGNAEHFTDLFGEVVKYSYVNKCWMYYDGRKWCDDMTGYVKALIDQTVELMSHELEHYIDKAEDPEELEKQYIKHLKNSRSSKFKTAMQKESEHRVAILPQQMDRDTALFNTTNGMLNLKTGELHNHDSKAFVTKISYTEYTDKSDYPIWEKFLKDIFNGDAELIRFIQKAVGYSLTGSTAEQCAFFCFGNGRNGKSTFLDVISEIMGDYAVNIQPDTIMIKKQGGGANSDIARLKGARFVTSVEPNEGMRLDEGLLKQLTGGDKVTARRLYGNEFEFQPEFKLWMGTNHKPVIRGTDLGIWRRIRLIPFTVQIPESRVDKLLKFKLKRELPGILNWAVEGCLLWQREGLNEPDCVKNATKEYKSEMDVLSSFLEACCEICDGRERASDLYHTYSNWAKENGEYVMSSTKFGTEISKRLEKARLTTGLFYQGVRILEEYKDYHIRIG